MKLFFVLLILVLTLPAIASQRLVTIDAFDFAYSGGLMIKNDSGKDPNREESSFKLNLNYAQNWTPYEGLMWRVRAFFNRQDTDFGGYDYLNTTWGGAGGIIFNVTPENINESIFLGAMVGLERSIYHFGNENEESGFNIFTDLEAGKRFNMGDYAKSSISYAPSLALSFKRYGGEIRNNYFRSGNEIKLNFLKFDIIF